MQVARLVAPARLRLSFSLSHCSTRLSHIGAPGLSKCHPFGCAGLSGSASRYFSAGTAELKALKQTVWPAIHPGWRYHTSKLVAFTAAAGYHGRVSTRDAVLCEKDQGDHRAWSPAYGANNREKQWEVPEWVEIVLVAASFVGAIFLGWHYPSSLVVTISLLLCWTKPPRDSIYVWAEQMRTEGKTEMSGFDRIRSQLTPGAVKHIEVEDYALFCLAKVSSLTQKSLVIGTLFKWWPVYSSTSSITAPGLGHFFPWDKYFPGLG